MKKPHILIISPASAKANNGNWRTAQRWRRFLNDAYRVSLSIGAELPAMSAPADAMIALHARRSADAVADFSAAFPARPLIMALTGTDLYRDIHTDRDAQRSLELASRLLVLQEAGLQELPPPLQQKTVVIHQSAALLKPVPYTHGTQGARRFTVSMVGHLREEKDPLTFMRACALAASRHHSSPLHFIHIGSALDPDLEQEARALQETHPCYRWLGNRSHGETRQLLKRSQLMAITSRMEGGANVIAEALTSGVPVLASDISGNRGMLGEGYAGYFPAGDGERLAALMERAAEDAAFYALLRRQCAARAVLFTPEREKAALLHLLDNAFKPDGLIHERTF